MDIKEILVIIVTENGEECIGNCLESVYSSTLLPEVMVIDNASVDQTVALLRKDNRILFIENKEKIGFAKANNIGINYALENRFDFVFLLHQNNKVHPDLFRIMMEIHKVNVDYGILSPMYLTETGTSMDNNFYHNVMLGCPEYTQARLLNQPLKSIYPVSFIHAGFWLISRLCLEEVGGFDPIFFHINGENDYINRIHYKGFKLGFCPDAYGYNNQEIKPPVTYEDMFIFKLDRIFEILKSPFIPLNKTYRSVLKKQMGECFKNLFMLRIVWFIFYVELIIEIKNSYKELKNSRKIDQSKLAHLQKCQNTSTETNTHKSYKSINYRKLESFFLSLKAIARKNNLTKLAELYKTDKAGAHNYTIHYMHHFSKMRYDKIKLLEIGVGGYGHPELGGNSLRMWKKYFPYGKIFGIDLYDKTKLEEERIKIFQGSQVDTFFLDQVMNKIGEPDIIIDDGSHMNEHVIETFKILFPKLKDNGIYVIEDTQTSYWPEYGGDSIDLNKKNTTMSFFKSLTDSLNYQEFILPFYKQTYFDQKIISIHFYHNLIFIHKGNNIEKSNVIGKFDSWNNFSTFIQ